MNSTYLECRDRRFATRGLTTARTLFFLMLVVLGLGLIVAYEVSAWPALPISDQQTAILTVTVAVIVGIALFYWGLQRIKRDCLPFTHYPIRFNRKNRMVHVANEDGTVTTTEWDNILFELTPVQDDLFEVRGTPLDWDHHPGTYSFSLPCIGQCDDPLPTSQWEFVRHYVEEGPEELMDQLDCVMDIAERRETLMHGFRCLRASFGRLGGILSPLIFFAAICRRFVMRTGRVPRWPDDVETECYIEPGDPFIRDARHLAPANRH